MATDNVTSEAKEKTPGSSIPELNKEDQYPAQGAYVGYLLTEYLSGLLTGVLTEVTFEEGVLCFFVSMGLFDEDYELVDELPLAVTFHRGTIALCCDSEERWEVMDETVIFKRLWAIAEHTGSLIALSCAETDAARVWDTEVAKEPEGKYVFPAPLEIH